MIVFHFLLFRFRKYRGIIKSHFCLLFWPCLPLMLIPYLICNKSLLILILSGIETLFILSVAIDP